MRPPAGKRPSLKSRCCPSPGESDKRLRRRLRHEIGPTQLREILLGLSDPDEPWRDLCHELMEQHYPTLGAKLDGKLADAYRELRYPAAKSDERDGLLDRTGWRLSPDCGDGEMPLFQGIPRCPQEVQYVENAKLSANNIGNPWKWGI